MKIDSIHNNKIISLILSLAIIIFLYFFFSSDAFLLWAFERHQNILSWYIRPLLVIPYCFFAYKKSINGILLIVLAIFTSMFWFPVPEVVTPKTIAFLEWEKQYLLGAMTLGKPLFFGIVVIYFILLAKAFWNRSLWLGSIIVILAALGKSVGSITMTPETGAVTIPVSIAGVILFLSALFIYKKYFSKNK